MSSILLSTSGEHSSIESGRTTSISVVIVTWNGCARVVKCLQALDQQVLHPEEILLVDNGSRDETLAVVRARFPRVRVLALGSNTGFAAATNQGIMASRGELIALLNNDTEPTPQWLQALMMALQDHPDAGWAASKLVWAQRPGIIDSAGDELWSLGVVVKRGDAQEDGPTYQQPGWVFGSCAGAALYRRSVLAAVGPFDERFAPAYHEDSDWNFRAQLQGFRCWYVPTAIVKHEVGATLGARSSTVLYLRARNTAFLLMKNLPGSLWWRLGASMHGYHLLVGLFYALTGRGGGYLRGWLGGLARVRAFASDQKSIQTRRVISDAAVRQLMRPMGVVQALRTHWRIRYARRR